MTDLTPADWGASDPSLIAETSTSRVVRVRLRDGRSAVIKDLRPIGVEDELRGADYLAWRAGLGAVRLIAWRGTKLLLEDAGDSTLLEDLGLRGDASAARRRAP